jgi:hypothetical protein
MIAIQNPGPDLKKQGAVGDWGATEQGMTAGENRVYFGLWSIMKSPLLLSADLTALEASVIDIVNNSAVIAINQDTLGVQARKLGLTSADGPELKPLPWLVGLEDCHRAPSKWYGRSLEPTLVGKDNREWAADALPVVGARKPGTTFALRNTATDRCLTARRNGAPGANRSMDDVVLLPCNGSTAQAWLFDKGNATVTSLTSESTGGALAVANSSLFGAVHVPSKAGDAFPTPDLAYGEPSIVLVDPYDQGACHSRDCQGYDPSQMWCLLCTG